MARLEVKPHTTSVLRQAGGRKVWSGLQFLSFLTIFWIVPSSPPIANPENVIGKFMKRHNGMKQTREPITIRCDSS